MSTIIEPTVIRAGGVAVTDIADWADAASAGGSAATRCACAAAGARSTGADARSTASRSSSP